jgi:zinc and cadmium transporter
MAVQFPSDLMGGSGWLILYGTVIVAASLLGGAIPSLVGLNHRRLQFGLSFVSGVMLGVAFFHMLPHAVMARAEAGGALGAHSHGLVEPIMLAAVAGFLAMFLLERFAHFHQHEIPEPACDSPEHGHAGHHHPVPHGVGRLTWTGAALGLGIHSLLEGVALAASVAAVADTSEGAVPALAGLGTFLVIVLHKPFDALTLATLFRAGGGTRTQLLAVNAAFAALVPVGVVLFLMGARASGEAGTIVPYALAFSAGTFLCIAASDLLPEVQFHRHDRGGLSAALVLGLALAWGIGLVEASLHEHAHAEHAHDGCEGHDHDHDHAHDHAPAPRAPSGATTPSGAAQPR